MVVLVVDDDINLIAGCWMLWLREGDEKNYTLSWVVGK